MTSTSRAVSFQHVGKTYRIASATERPAFLAEAAVRRLRHPLRRAPREDFVALDDVTLDIPAGQALGIIGRNGAGKSTLLKILSRITTPTTGRVEIRGRVGSLLEVGTGFHPELTGRENVYLNGAILGMRTREIDRAFDSIVRFAQVERFLETPVKRYSSGMYVRLAFAVAAHLSTEILVVDEVLAVGDIEFQRRCLGKMGEVTSHDGRTVVFVSHNMAAVEAFCRRCVHLEAGRVVADGTPAEAIGHYLASGARGSEEGAGVFDLSEVRRTASNSVPMFRRVEIRNDTGMVTDRIRMGDGIAITIDAEGLALPRHGVTVRILTGTDVPIIAMNTGMRPIDVDPTAAQQRLTLSIPSLPLTPARYWVEVVAAEGSSSRKTIIDHVERAASFEVEAADVYGSGYPVPGAGPRAGIVYVPMAWKVESEGLVVGTSSGTTPAQDAAAGGRTGHDGNDDQLLTGGDRGRRASGSDDVGELGLAPLE